MALTPAQEQLRLDLIELKASPTLKRPSSGICGCIDGMPSTSTVSKRERYRALYELRKTVSPSNPVFPISITEGAYANDAQQAFDDAEVNGTMWAPATAGTYGAARLAYLDRLIAELERQKLLPA
jgi:hypothetical protein